MKSAISVLFVFSYGQYGPIAQTATEFSSEATCQAAQKRVERLSGDIRTICVAK